MLAGTQHAGATGHGGGCCQRITVRRHGVTLLRPGTVGGCLASALVLLALASGGPRAEDWHLSANVFLLGFANGAFAVAAIAAMLTHGERRRARTGGLRMGLGGFTGDSVCPGGDSRELWRWTFAGYDRNPSPCLCAGVHVRGPDVSDRFLAGWGWASAKVMRKPCPKRHPVLGTSQCGRSMPGSN